MDCLTSVGQSGDDDAAASSGGDHEAGLDDGDDGQPLGLGDDMSCNAQTHHDHDAASNAGGGAAGEDGRCLTGDEFVRSVPAGDFGEVSQDLGGFLRLGLQVGGYRVAH